MTASTQFAAHLADANEAAARKACRLDANCRSAYGYKKKLWVRCGALALAATILAGCNRTPMPFAHDARCAIRGLDVSRHQGAIDWPAAADAGTRFVWIKATEGGDYRDPAFRRNWYLSGAAGVRRGAYHFMTWCRKPQEQAAWFVANVPADPDALPPVLDVEWNPASRSCPQKVSREVALAAMQVVLDAMETSYGRKPVIYAPLDFYEDVMAGALVDYPLWVRNIESAPGEGYGRPWAIWQRQDGGTVDGIGAPVDVNCFHGDETKWRGWFSGSGDAATVIPDP